MDEKSEHFVYVYRDISGNPVYFGQGKRPSRAAFKKRGPQNKSFGAWLDDQGARAHLEIIGPYGSKETADAVETALISACAPSKALAKTFFNSHGGVTRYRFRPFGVPERYADRTALPLTRKGLRDLSNKWGGVMFVKVSDKRLEAHGSPEGYDFAKPMADDELRERVQAWWQVETAAQHWIADPSTSPRLLVGVAGAPGAQIIVAAMEINERGWKNTEKSGSTWRVPLKKRGLDASELRGRPIEADVGLRFQALRHGFFRLHRRSGFYRASGGKLVKLPLSLQGKRASGA